MKISIISVSISGYHIAEAGANPISQLAFMFCARDGWLRRAGRRRAGGDVGVVAFTAGAPAAWRVTATNSKGARVTCIR